MIILVTMHPPKCSWCLVLRLEQAPELITGTEGTVEDGGVQGWEISAPQPITT